MLHGIHQNGLDFRRDVARPWIGFVAPFGVGHGRTNVGRPVIAVGRHGNVQVRPHLLGGKLVLDEQLARARAEGVDVRAGRVRIAESVTDLDGNLDAALWRPR